MIPTELLVAIATGGLTYLGLRLREKTARMAAEDSAAQQVIDRLQLQIERQDALIQNLYRRVDANSIECQERVDTLRAGYESRVLKLEADLHAAHSQAQQDIAMLRAQFTAFGGPHAQER